MRSRLEWAAVAAVVVMAGCGRREPPTWNEGPSTVAPPPELPPLEGPPRADGAADGDGGPSLPGAGGAEGAAGGAASPLAALDLDAGALPQTQDRPSTATAAFRAKAALLVEAIAHDAPERALPAFFPLAAYEQVKDVKNPAADWKHRLVAAFNRDLKDLHLKLGKDAATARLVALEVPESRARWVEPGEEYNRLGYYRVFGSHLVVEVGGRKRSLEIRSLISWRGEWYVVHLSAMK